MKIPKKITIFGRIYKVEIVKDLALGDDEANGTIHPDKQIIRVRPSDKNLSKDGQIVSFLHELAHAFGHATDHDLYNNEVFCNTLAEFMYQIFKQMEDR